MFNDGGVSPITLPYVWKLSIKRYNPLLYLCTRLLCKYGTTQITEHTLLAEHTQTADGHLGDNVYSYL